MKRILFTLTTLTVLLLGTALYPVYAQINASGRSNLEEGVDATVKDGETATPVIEAPTPEAKAEALPAVLTTPEPKERLLKGVLSVDENQTGDYFRGYSKTLSWDRMIAPYALEVAYDKTTHIIFPSTVRYVDLGNTNLIAGKAGEAENVIRVKSAYPYFEGETNLAVITEDGSFYSFNVRFAEEPLKLNVEMKDFLNDGSAQNRPNNSIEVFLKELGQESPTLVKMIMKSIYDQNIRMLRHLGSKVLGIQYLCKGLYAHNDLLYFHMELKNRSSVPYNIDYITFKFVDKKLIKRVTTQEIVLQPVRAYNYVTRVEGRETQHTVMAFPIFTIPQEKTLEIDIHEKDGGRHQTIRVENDDLIRAKILSEFIVQ